MSDIAIRVEDLGKQFQIGALQERTKFQYRTLRDQLLNLSVVGGCCGTDERHVTAIADACAPARAAV